MQTSKIWNKVLIQNKQFFSNKVRSCVDEQISRNDANFKRPCCLFCFKYIKNWKLNKISKINISMHLLVAVLIELFISATNDWTSFIF